MATSTFENIISKIKKVTKKPKNSKYYKKFMIIVKKQKKRILERASLRSNRRVVPINIPESIPEAILLNISNSTDDSGINKDSSPVYPPPQFLTCAIIEPVPAKFTNDEKSPRSILDASITDDFKLFVSNENQLNQNSQLSEQSKDEIRNRLNLNTLSNSAPIAEEEVYYENIGSGDNFGRCSKSLYQSANGYSPLLKWNRISTDGKKVYSCPPKKPPRLYLNRASTPAKVGAQQPPKSNEIENLQNMISTENMDQSSSAFNANKYKRPNQLDVKKNNTKLLQRVFEEEKLQKLSSIENKIMDTKVLTSNLNNQCQSKSIFRYSPKADSVKFMKIEAEKSVILLESSKVSESPSIIKTISNVNKLQNTLVDTVKEKASEAYNENERSLIKEQVDYDFNKTSTKRSDQIQPKNNLTNLVEDNSKMDGTLDSIDSNLSQHNAKPDISHTSKNVTVIFTPSIKKNDDLDKKLVSENEDFVKSVRKLNGVLNRRSWAHDVKPTEVNTTYRNLKRLSSTLKSNTSSEASSTSNNEVYSHFLNGLTSKVNNQLKDVEEKFVVNLFESRQSKRWKRHTVHVGQFDNIKILNDVVPNEMIHKTAPEDQKEKSDTIRDEIYFKMKKMRDIECGKMKEASNALRAIRNNPNKTWSEELLAESILLETELRFKSIVNTIRDTKDSANDFENPKISGGITLSNFQFELQPQQHKKNLDATTFFLMAVSQNTNIITTKAVLPTEDNKLVFNETFALKGVNENFRIKAEIYSITLNTVKPGFVEKFLKRKAKCCYPINKIYFENVNTFELQESAILKHSFTSYGELIITQKDLGRSLFLMEKHQNEKIKNIVTANINVDYMNLNPKYSGFLTLGKMDENRNIHYWERKWCSFENKTFSIYNYPQDEEFDRPPAACINLEYCFIPLVKHPKDCPRKRTFVIKTGRPSTLNESTCSKQLKRKDNFVLNKYYLSADTCLEYEKWTELVDSALIELDNWGRLIFKDEYYL